ncbi:hypothetical protein DM49_3555 [Burkholderia mallei]|nr:hypothetical protein DM49_3555 [Burkholderia mallei]KOS91666.1 hypothetical protein DM53_4394 [Burkholderia mallei]
MPTIDAASAYISNLRLSTPPCVAYAPIRSSARCVFRSASSAISTYGYQALFIPISAAAVSAAWVSSGDSTPASRIAFTSTGLLAAKAAASAAPTASVPSSDEREIVPSRFRRMSFA